MRKAAAFFLLLATLLSLSFGPARAQQAPGAFDRQALREELMKLPPGERRARIQQLRQQFQQNGQQQLGQRQEQIRDRWNRATPEQRAKFCANIQQRCAADARGPACQTATGLCTRQGG